MTIRIIIAGLVGAVIIIGGVVLFENSGAPAPRSQGAPQAEESAVQEDTPDPIPAGWQRHENAALRFTVDYPENWDARAEANAVSFMPLQPAPQEAEPNPRIILTLVPLVNILGQYASASTWFDTEVLKNPERWEERADTQDGNPRYSFTEGAGQYPHENIIILHGATAYWFSIEASDQAMHELLPQFAATLQFAQ